jgi:ABC-type nickel/cobalt efflux system permease component RcnA
VLRKSILVALLALLLIPLGSADAHPADRLKQQLFLTFGASGIDATLAIGGGILANELVLDEIDPNRDKTIEPAEQTAWLAEVLSSIRVSVDGTDRGLDPAAAGVALPAYDDFHVGAAPILVSFTIPYEAGAGRVDHRLILKQNYHVDRTDFSMTAMSDAGAAVTDEGWPGRQIRISFVTDPAIATSSREALDAANDWAKGGILDRAKAILEKPKTPWLVATLLFVFAVMGALHAMQPGHGKTLVAAYLVATGGTPRDALTLAGIVTFTHTISVFALGGATLLASHFFLPSRVIPVMSVISGLLVAGMGLMMLKRALLSRRQPHLHAHDHHHEHEHHHHDHDHAQLSDEEHARLHLEEALAVRGRAGVSRRSLITLGVSGGLAPCPDALAILLLAIGINQAGFGMLAIVAFSAGLAGVLVAFGLAIALAGPFWTRLQAGAAERGGIGASLNAIVSRLAAAGPAISGAVVLLLGLGMIWRA